MSLQSNAAGLYHAAVCSSALYNSCSTNISPCSGNIHTLTLWQKTRWNYLPSIAVWLFSHILLLFQWRERITEEMTKVSQPAFLEFTIWKLFPPYSLDTVRSDSSVISAALNITADLTIQQMRKIKIKTSGHTDTRILTNNMLCGWLLMKMEVVTLERSWFASS